MMPTAEAAAAGERTLSAFTFASRFDKSEEPTEAPTFNTPGFKNFKSTNDDGDEGDEGDEGNESDEGNEGDEGSGRSMTSHTITASLLVLP